MRFALSIAILLLASVPETASSWTQTTTQGPIQQGSASTSGSALPEDCLSPVDWHDIVFTIAVPIATGFGLLLLLASLQDLWQAYKSAHPRPSSSPKSSVTGACREHTYIVDIEYGPRSRWAALLRWFAINRPTSDPRLVRLQGTVGYSEWYIFDLTYGCTSEKRTVTAPLSIGKLVALENKYPVPSSELNAVWLQYDLGARFRGVINRACIIEIKNIHVTDAEAQDDYITGCGPSSGGVSFSEKGISTLLPLRPAITARPRSPSKLSYMAYYLRDCCLLTSALLPWRGAGNFTGVRRITCLFACVAYPMAAVQMISEPHLGWAWEAAVIASPVGVDITAGLAIRAGGLALLLFPVHLLLEVLARATPACWLPEPASDDQPEPGQQLMMMPGTDTKRSDDGSQVTVVDMEAGEAVPARRPPCHAALRYLACLITALAHLLLISSCVLAVLWSVSSVHGLCWTALWEWLATCILAVLLQVGVLDTAKALVMTAVKVQEDRKSRAPRPHALIY